MPLIFEMQDLATLREGWDEFERQKRRALGEDLTASQSVAIFLALYRALTPMLDETEELFRGERNAYLAQLQSRLLRLEEWRQKHGTDS